MVDSLATMMPPPLRPMNAMNKPMPMPIAWRKLTGIASMTALRKPQATRIRITIPSRKTMAIATRQSTAAPPRQSVYATIALMPMPDASAIGLFAIRPIAMVMIAAPKHVAVSAASNGTPATTSIFGFTAMMYAIARNVVKPPMISFPIVLLRSEILKNESTFLPFPCARAKAIR